MYDWVVKVLSFAGALGGFPTVAASSNKERREFGGDFTGVDNNKLRVGFFETSLLLSPLVVVVVVVVELTTLTKVFESKA